MSKKIELLAPAGNLERLKIAFLYGADAVYVGGKNYSLRANANNFSDGELEEACIYAHKLKKKIYVAVNIVFHNDNYEGLVDYLSMLAKIGVDAVIVSDPSVIDLIKDNKIDLKIHISTQMSVASLESVRFFKNEGAERVVLARECSRDEIKEIIDKTGIEVECFLHGAMCSGYSGRCVLSNYFTNRDANRGGCAQVCRWVFDLNDGKHDIVDNTKFTMCTKDLSLIKHLGEMIEIGVSSLKVEGRMRSDYYIATVIGTYREAIDNYYAGKLDENRLMYYGNILNRVANRESTSQFFASPATVDDQYFLGRQEISNQDFLGVVLDYDEEKKEVVLMQRNYFKPGDMVEMFGPSIETFSFVVPKIYNKDGEEVEVANHPQEIIRFHLDKRVYKQDIMRVKVFF